MNLLGGIFVMIVSIFMFAHKSDSAKILGIFVGAGKTHSLLGNVLMQYLAEAGHEVVLITEFEDQNMQDIKYEQIIVHEDEHSDSLFNAIKETNHNPFYVIDRIYQNSKQIIPKVYENTEVKALLNRTFDLIIVEQIFMNSLGVFAWHFQAPLVVFHPFRADSLVNSYVGNPNFPSFIPEFPAPYDSVMNFLVRCANAVLYIYNLLFKEFVCLEEQNEIMKKYFPQAPDLSEIAYNTSMILLNSDLSTDQPIPKVPNMIDIGGFHITTPKSLPPDVLSFLNKSVKGVVFVRLDPLTSNYLSEETRRLLVSVFSSFKHDFLWQWDEERVPDQPPNLLMRKSLSPQDVLANPNVKLYIHLGDSQHLIEGINYGIPQLLLPLLDEQYYNAAEAQQNGYAWKIAFPDITESDLSWAINELLDNRKYTNESLRRSKIFKEKLISPKKAMLYWIDYVIQTEGAEHLRSAALKYSWYQLFMLDIFGFFLASILVIIILLILIIKLICRKCCPCCKKKEESDYISVNEHTVL
ncbi:hypothetical protein WA026_002904 [Henosepilachna vigintioctopunctata]|uniref:UDP-glycosyltransferase n=1 Tax=Henosepilachna vigintioctopunctata TaxID=420089 RepID=A0AAW1TL05_9CUCU